MTQTVKYFSSSDLRPWCSSPIPVPCDLWKGATFGASCSWTGKKRNTALCVMSLQEISCFSFLPVTKTLWFELGLETEFDMVGELQFVSLWMTQGKDTCFLEVLSGASRKELLEFKRSALFYMSCLLRVLSQKLFHEQQS